MLPDDRLNRLRQSREAWMSRRRLGLLAVLAIASAAVRLANSDRIVSAKRPQNIAQSESQLADQSSTAELPISTAMATEMPTAITTQIYELPNATVHVVLVPPDRTVTVMAADELRTVREFAEGMKANGRSPLAIINGGFFDPNNGKTTSHLVVNRDSIGDPAENEGLTDNPKMQPYLPQIFNRSEFRVYDCPLASVMTPYAIAAHDAPIPAGCDLTQAIGAGPQLLPEETSEAEAFTQYEDGELIRDALGSLYPNARSAIGIHEEGSAMLIMAAQRPAAAGFTLADVSEFAASLGARQLLNLDGGSSASLYYDDELHLGRLNAAGEAIERPVKSVIVVE